MSDGDWTDQWRVGWAAMEALYQAQGSVYAPSAITVQIGGLTASVMDGDGQGKPLTLRLSERVLTDDIPDVKREIRYALADALGWL